MPRRRISPLFAVLVAFVVLMASNAWLKSIFGYGEIATDIPFLLAGAILFLASDDASYITGVTLPVSGGDPG